MRNTKRVRADGGTGGGPTIGVTQAEADQRVTAQSFRALSLRLRPANDTEAAHVTEQLSAGGERQPGGWLRDKYGVSWQISAG